MKRSSRREKKFIVLKQTNDVDKIINFFMKSYWSKTGIFVKLMRKVSMKWKNWSDFRVLHSTQLQEEDWSKTKILSFNKKRKSIYSESAYASNRDIKKDKVNSLSGSRDFCDLETASSSGLSHVPSHLVTVLNLCGMLAACLGNVRSVTDTRCELVSLNTGSCAATEEEVERNIFETGQCLHRDLPGSF